METLSLLTGVIGDPAQIVVDFLTPSKQEDYEICKFNGLTEISYNVKDVNKGLRGACNGGHLALAEKMIQNGATHFNRGLDNACRGGHLDLVQLMIQNGATSCNCGKSLETHKIN